MGKVNQLSQDKKDKDLMDLLRDLKSSKDGGAFAQACDGVRRELAHKLEDMGFVCWKGTNWGSSFYTITEAGEKVLADA